MICESHREPLPRFGARLGVGVILPLTFGGEVGGGGLKLPLFDVVSTGRVFHHAILFFRLIMSSLSPGASTHTCVLKATRERMTREKGSKKNPPGTSFLWGMKT